MASSSNKRKILAGSFGNFVELYDFAPVAYLTLSRSGIIQQANLTSVSMLGVERLRLVTVPLSHFVLPPDQETLALIINYSDTKSGQNASIGQAKQALSFLQNHYPERLGRALVINSA